MSAEDRLIRAEARAMGVALYLLMKARGFAELARRFSGSDLEDADWKLQMLAAEADALLSDLVDFESLEMKARNQSLVEFNDDFARRRTGSMDLFRDDEVQTLQPTQQES